MNYSRDDGSLRWFIYSGLSQCIVSTIVDAAFMGLIYAKVVFIFSLVKRVNSLSLVNIAPFLFGMCKRTVGLKTAFAQLARPQHRSKTIVFSRNICVAGLAPPPPAHNISPYPAVVSCLKLFSTR